PDSRADQAGLYRSSNQKNENQITSYFSDTTLALFALRVCGSLFRPTGSRVCILLPYPVFNLRAREPPNPAYLEGRNFLCSGQAVHGALCHLEVGRDLQDRKDVCFRSGHWRKPAINGELGNECQHPNPTAHRRKAPASWPRRPTGSFRLTY